MHANTLIALAIQHTDRRSLRSLAERMGVSHTKVSEWKSGTKPVPEERIHQLAKIAGQDPGPWLLLIKSEQEEGELGRLWAKLAKQLATTSAAVLLALVIPWTAHAKNSYFSGVSASESAVTASYVKCSSAGGGPFGVSPGPQLPSQPDRNRGDSMKRKDRSPTVAIVTVAAWPLEWSGWGFDSLGRLVSPERHRITPERLQGLLWRQDAEARRDAARARRLAEKRVSRMAITVVRIPNDDWHRERFGSIAG